MGRQGRDRCGDRWRRACGRSRAPQQPAGAECYRAPRRDRRVRGDLRPPHALHHDPEPPRHPPAHGGLRARHSGIEAARRGAGCRRWLRLQGLPLCRGGDRHLGRTEDRPPGQVDLGADGFLPERRSRPRPRDAGQTRPRCERHLRRPPCRDGREHGRLSLHLRERDPDLSLRDVCCRACTGRRRSMPR